MLSSNMSTEVTTVEKAKGMIVHDQSAIEQVREPQERVSNSQ